MTEFLTVFIKLFGFNSVYDYTSTFASGLLTEDQSANLIISVNALIPELKKYYHSREFNLSKQIETTERCVGLLKKCLDLSHILYETVRIKGLTHLRLISPEIIVMSYIRQMDGLMICAASNEETLEAQELWKRADKKVLHLQVKGVTLPDPVEKFYVRHQDGRKDFLFQNINIQHQVIDRCVALRDQPILKLGGMVPLHVGRNPVRGVRRCTVNTTPPLIGKFNSDDSCIDLSLSETIGEYGKLEMLLFNAFLSDFELDDKVSFNGFEFNSALCYAQLYFNHCVFEMKFSAVNEANIGFEGFYSADCRIDWRSGDESTIFLRCSRDLMSATNIIMSDDQKRNSVDFSRISSVFAILKPQDSPISIQVKSYGTIMLSKDALCGHLYSLC